jgi:hypothetical protein
MIMEEKHDPANYRKMSEPIPSQEEASKLLAGFMEAVEKARKDFHMQDVHVIVQMNIMNSSGNEQGAMSSAHFGHSLHAPPCAPGLWGMRNQISKRLSGSIYRRPDECDRMEFSSDM